MTSPERVQVVLELLEGRASVTELALRHGVAEEELLAWRDTWLAGARASARPAVASLRLYAIAGVLGAVALGFISQRALAASCATPGNFSSLGLRYFCANDPAVAADVNANTAQLVALMQQKLGSSWGAADAGAGSSGITTSTTTVTGTSTLTGGATVGPTANVSFGNQTRQMLNLWGTSYGMGVQNNTLYFRSASDFAWFVGGTHSDTALDPGAGGTMAMKLSPNGALSVRGLKQVDGATPAVAPYELQRLIVEATPATVGIAQRIDQAALEALCRDDDGCPFTISMVNWNGDGMAATRSGTLFLSQTGSAWRLEIAGSDFQGVDGDNSVAEFSAFDCYFGDANSSSAGNARTDTGTGFSLLNCAGCTYSDTLTTCRMVFRD